MLGDDDVLQAAPSLRKDVALLGVAVAVKHPRSVTRVELTRRRRSEGDMTDRTARR